MKFITAYRVKFNLWHYAHSVCKKLELKIQFSVKHLITDVCMDECLVSTSLNYFVPFNTQKTVFYDQCYAYT